MLSIPLEMDKIRVLDETSVLFVFDAYSEFINKYTGWLSTKLIYLTKVKFDFGKFL